MEKLKKYVLLFLFLSVTILSFVSYGKARDYYFWRDDTYMAWAGKYQPHLLVKNELTRDRLLGAKLNIWFYTSVIGINHTTWQDTGLALKIANSFLLYFLIVALGGSTTYGLIGALFYASSFGGLEAYSWARLVGFEITLLILTFICYAKSYFQKSNKWFALALVLAIVTLSMELWRTVAILLIIPLWEASHMFASERTLRIKTSVIRIVLFLVISLATLNFIVGKTGGEENSQSTLTTYSTTLFNTLSAGSFKAFTISVGHLARSPIFPIQEEGALSSGDQYSEGIGIIFVVFTLLTFVLFITTRKTKWIIPLTFCVWVLAFYFPNWIYETKLTIGATHRYFGISALGLSILVGYLINKIKHPYQIAVVLILIWLGTSNSIEIVNRDYQIRGSKIVRPVIDKLIGTITPGEKRSVINVWGDNAIRGYVFDWSGPFLYTYLRGIASFDDFPIFVNNHDGSSLLCDPQTLITDWEIGGKRPAGFVAQLNKYHGYYINNYGVLEDRTVEFRMEVAKNAPCLTKEQEVEVSPGLRVASTTLIRDVDGKGSGTTGLVVNWERTRYEQDGLYTFVLYLTDKRLAKTLRIESGTVKFASVKVNAQTVLVFDNSQDNLTIPDSSNGQLTLMLKTCNLFCDFSTASGRFVSIDL